MRVQESAASALGEIMSMSLGDVKKVLGLCSCKGCIKRAKRLMTIKTDDGEIKQIQLCDDCAWKLYLGE